MLPRCGLTSAILCAREVENTRLAPIKHCLDSLDLGPRPAKTKVFGSFQKCCSGTGDGSILACPAGRCRALMPRVLPVAASRHNYPRHGSHAASCGGCSQTRCHMRLPWPSKRIASGQQPGAPGHAVQETHRPLDVRLLQVGVVVRMDATNANRSYRGAEGARGCLSCSGTLR